MFINVRLIWNVNIKVPFSTMVQIIGQIFPDDYKKLPYREELSEVYYERFKLQLIAKLIQIIEFAEKYNGRILEVEKPDVMGDNNITVFFYLIFENSDCVKEFVRDLTTKGFNG